MIRKICFLHVRKIFLIKKKSLNWFLAFFILVFIILPLTIQFTPSNLILSYRISPDSTLQINNKEEILLSKKEIIEQNQTSPEAYFPNFLYYAIELGNLLIDYLYDNVSDGFFRSTDEHWLESNIDTIKYTYDQAQAILSFLKLSKALINETESDFALEVAKNTSRYLLSNLYDHEFGGFYHNSMENYKKVGIQAQVILSLLELYEVTGNSSYLDIAVDVYDFYDLNGWDGANKGYYYVLSHIGYIPSQSPIPNDPFDPKGKRVDHNAIMGLALTDLYKLTSDSLYLSRAAQIYSLINNTCINESTLLYFAGINGEGEIVNPEESDIFTNTLVLEFLASLYRETGNFIYYNDFFALLNSVFYHFWDSRSGGFHATYSYDPQIESDTKKYTERQFYMIKALDAAYKLTNDSFYYNLILDIIEFLTNKLYDQNHGGYFQLSDETGVIADTNWKQKYAVTQSLAISVLSDLWMYSKPGVLNALWIPTNPRPQDSVTISVAAFDADGIKSIIINYSLNNEVYQTDIMTPHHLIGDMYEYFFDSQFDGTTVNFNIIVTDNMDNQIIRGSYFFLWEIDTWGPHINILALDPGDTVPVHSKVTITISAHDIPSQGTIENVRVYYHKTGEAEQTLRLEEVNIGIWRIIFSEGFEKPGTYAYYFEAMDDKGNVGYSALSYLYVEGHLESLPLTFIIGALFFVLIFLPTILYTFVEYKKKHARKTLKSIRETKKVKKRVRKGLKRTNKELVN